MGLAGGLVPINAPAYRDTPLPNCWSLADFPLLICVSGERRLLVRSRVISAPDLKRRKRPRLNVAALIKQVARCVAAQDLEVTDHVHLIEISKLVSDV